MPSCLVVDDSKVVRRLERGFLQDLGFTVDEAESGDAAAEYCKTKMPDLIILDWYMPGMDGPTFLQLFRTMPNAANTKVVMCTTENDIQKITYAMSIGADEYVIKPFDAEIIKLKLQQIQIL